VCQERLCSLGRLDKLRESGNIDRIIASLVKIAKEDWVRKEAVQLEAAWSKQYGVVVLVQRLWHDLGFAEVIGEVEAARWRFRWKRGSWLW